MTFLKTRFKMQVGPTFNHFALLSLLLALFSCSLGCEENRDVSTPLGGYNVFKNALEAGDGPLVWSRLSDNSKAFFDKKYQTLRNMDQTIETYLPPTDHAIAQRQAGTVMLDKAKNGEELFLELFDSSALKAHEKDQDWAVELGNKGRSTFAQIPGVELPKIVLSEDGSSAVVDAPGVQVAMVLTQTQDGKPQWFVDLVRSGNIVKQNLAWVDTNQEALTKTVDDLIAEQRQEREELIADLMGFKKSKKK